MGAARWAGHQWRRAIPLLKRCGRAAPRCRYNRRRCCQHFRFLSSLSVSGSSPSTSSRRRSRKRSDVGDSGLARRFEARRSARRNVPCERPLGLYGGNGYPGGRGAVADRVGHGQPHGTSLRARGERRDGVPSVPTDARCVDADSHRGARGAPWRSRWRGVGQSRICRGAIRRVARRGCVPVREGVSAKTPGLTATEVRRTCRMHSWICRGASIVAIHERCASMDSCTICDLRYAVYGATGRSRWRASRC